MSSCMPICILYRKASSVRRRFSIREQIVLEEIIEKIHWNLRLHFNDYDFTVVTAFIVFILHTLLVQVRAGTGFPEPLHWSVTVSPLEIIIWLGSLRTLGGTEIHKARFNWCSNSQKSTNYFMIHSGWINVDYLEFREYGPTRPAQKCSFGRHSPLHLRDVLSLSPN
jgi:hypothetical protein